MTYPIGYVFAGSPFTAYEATNPTTPKPGSQLDYHFSSISSAIASHIAFTRKIQADDGTLRSGIVGPSQLTGNLFNAILQHVAARIEDAPWRIVLAAVDSVEATAGQTVFPLSITPTVSDNVIVDVGGALQTRTANDYSFSGSSLVLSSAPPEGTRVTARHFSGATITVDTFVAGASQTVFALSRTPMDPAFVMCAVGGVAQTPNVHFTLNGRNVEMSGIPAGERVTFWTLREMEITANEFSAVGWCQQNTTSCGC